jgi:hypothetical protein
MEKQVDIKENTDKLIAFICKKYESGELDNESLVELFKVIGIYLNLQTIPDYAKTHGMTYEGVKRGRRIEEIYGIKFVIDND